MRVIVVESQSVTGAVSLSCARLLTR